MKVFDCSAIMLCGVIDLPLVVSIGLVAVLVALSCAAIGSLLVLRRMSLMGDAISHAVLPGLVIAYLLTGSLQSNAMLVGAFGIGLLTTWMIQALEKLGGIAADTSMGVVFTALFACGVVMLKVATGGSVDLDVDCVLNGSLSTIPLDTIEVAGYNLPNAAVLPAATLVINLGVLLLFWKELRLCAFDEQFAATNGFRPELLHYMIMALTAMTAVASFQAVGSILVIAMLIVPAATAQLLSDRMNWFVAIALLVGFCTAVLGVLLGQHWIRDAEPAALVAVCAGVLFFLTALFAPQYGIAARILRHSRRRMRIQGEDLLAMFYRLEELAPGRKLGSAEAVQSIGGGLLARLALWRQMSKGLLDYRNGGWRLTALGEEHGANLVRSHRLWEVWLVKHLGLPLDHVHAPAERMEHFIDREMQAELRKELASEADPHGRAIPQ